VTLVIIDVMLLITELSVIDSICQSEVAAVQQANNQSPAPAAHLVFRATEPTNSTASPDFSREEETIHIVEVRFIEILTV
jgi:hypothetical protein